MRPAPDRRKLILRARRRRLFDSLVRQGIDPMKASRWACAVHRTRPVHDGRRRTALDASKHELWVPPHSAAASQRRLQQAAHDRVAARLAKSLSMTSEIAHRIAAESMRRVDTTKAAA